MMKSKQNTSLIVAQMKSSPGFSSDVQHPKFSAQTKITEAKPNQKSVGNTILKKLESLSSDVGTLPQRRRGRATRCKDFAIAISSEEKINVKPETIKNVRENILESVEAQGSDIETGETCKTIEDIKSCINTDSSANYNSNTTKATDIIYEISSSSSISTRLDSAEDSFLYRNLESENSQVTSKFIYDETDEEPELMVAAIEEIETDTCINDQSQELESYDNNAEDRLTEQSDESLQNQKMLNIVESCLTMGSNAVCKKMIKLRSSRSTTSGSESEAGSERSLKHYKTGNKCRVNLKRLTMPTSQNSASISAGQSDNYLISNQQNNEKNTVKNEEQNFITTTSGTRKDVINLIETEILQESLKRNKPNIEELDDSNSLSAKLIEENTVEHFQEKSISNSKENAKCLQQIENIVNQSLKVNEDKNNVGSEECAEAKNSFLNNEVSNKTSKEVAQKKYVEDSIADDCSISEQEETEKEETPRHTVAHYSALKLRKRISPRLEKAENISKQSNSQELQEPNIMDCTEKGIQRTENESDFAPNVEITKVTRKGGSKSLGVPSQKKSDKSSSSCNTNKEIEDNVHSMSNKEIFDIASKESQIKSNSKISNDNHTAIKVFTDDNKVPESREKVSEVKSNACIKKLSGNEFEGILAEKDGSKEDISEISSESETQPNHMRNTSIQRRSDTRKIKDTKNVEIAEKSLTTTTNEGNKTFPEIHSDSKEVENSGAQRRSRSRKLNESMNTESLAPNEVNDEVSKKKETEVKKMSNSSVERRSGRKVFLDNKTIVLECLDVPKGKISDFSSETEPERTRDFSVEQQTVTKKLNDNKNIEALEEKDNSTPKDKKQKELEIKEKCNTSVERRSGRKNATKNAEVVGETCVQSCDDVLKQNIPEKDSGIKKNTDAYARQRSVTKNISDIEILEKEKASTQNADSFSIKESEIKEVRNSSVERRSVRKNASKNVEITDEKCVPTRGAKEQNISQIIKTVDSSVKQHSESKNISDIEIPEEEKVSTKNSETSSIKESETKEINNSSLERRSRRKTFDDKKNIEEQEDKGVPKSPECSKEKIAIVSKEKESGIKKIRDSSIEQSSGKKKLPENKNIEVLETKEFSSNEKKSEISSEKLLDIRKKSHALGERRSRRKTIHENKNIEVQDEKDVFRVNELSKEKTSIFSTEEESDMKISRDTSFEKRSDTKNLNENENIESVENNQVSSLSERMNEIESEKKSEIKKIYSAPIERRSGRKMFTDNKNIEVTQDKEVSKSLGLSKEKIVNADIEVAIAKKSDLTTKQCSNTNVSDNKTIGVLDKKPVSTSKQKLAEDTLENEFESLEKNSEIKKISSSSVERRSGRKTFSEYRNIDVPEKQVSTCEDKIYEVPEGKESGNNSFVFHTKNVDEIEIIEEKVSSKTTEKKSETKSTNSNLVERRSGRKTFSENKIVEVQDEKGVSTRRDFSKEEISEKAQGVKRTRDSSIKLRYEIKNVSDTEVLDGKKSPTKIFEITSENKSDIKDINSAAVERRSGRKTFNENKISVELEEKEDLKSEDSSKKKLSDVSTEKESIPKKISDSSVNQPTDNKNVNEHKNIEILQEKKTDEVSTKKESDIKKNTNISVGRRSGRLTFNDNKKIEILEEKEELSSEDVKFSIEEESAIKSNRDSDTKKIDEIKRKEDLEVKKKSISKEDSTKKEPDMNKTTNTSAERRSGRRTFNEKKIIEVLAETQNSELQDSSKQKFDAISSGKESGVKKESKDSTYGPRPEAGKINEDKNVDIVKSEKISSAVDEFEITNDSNITIERRSARKSFRENKTIETVKEKEDTSKKEMSAEIPKKESQQVEEGKNQDATVFGTEKEEEINMTGQVANTDDVTVIKNTAVDDYDSSAKNKIKTQNRLTSTPTPPFTLNKSTRRSAADSRILHGEEKSRKTLEETFAEIAALSSKHILESSRASIDLKSQGTEKCSPADPSKEDQTAVILDNKSDKFDSNKKYNSNISMKSTKEFVDSNCFMLQEQNESTYPEEINKEDVNKKSHNKQQAKIINSNILPLEVFTKIDHKNDLNVVANKKNESAAIFIAEDQIKISKSESFKIDEPSLSSNNEDAYHSKVLPINLLSIPTPPRASSEIYLEPLCDIEHNNKFSNDQVYLEVDQEKHYERNVIENRERSPCTPPMPIDRRKRKHRSNKHSENRKKKNKSHIEYDSDEELYRGKNSCRKESKEASHDKKTLDACKHDENLSKNSKRNLREEIEEASDETCDSTTKTKIVSSLPKMPNETDTDAKEKSIKHEGTEEEPDPLKDIEKFIEDGVNLLKRDYKHEEDGIEHLAEKKEVEGPICSEEMTALDISSHTVPYETPADTPATTPSGSPPSKSPIGEHQDYEYSGVRRSHRIKQISKTPKALVGRGLVRDKERFSLRDDSETKSTYSLDDHLTDLAEVEAINAQFLKDMEERLSNFQVIKENEYHCHRVISKEARKMICDCFLTAEEEERGEMGCGEDCLNRLLMIECGVNCNVKDRCTNKRFQMFLCSPCRVFRTEKKGFGIMADIEILPGEFIMEYVGEVINGEEFEERRTLYSMDKNRHYYFMALRSDAIIDATVKGNISRFINHSCDPNAETQKWTVNGELRIGFFSRKSIMPGEEITFDYQYQRYGRDAQRCYCESTNCRGWIGEEPTSDEGEQLDDDSDDNLAKRLLEEQSESDDDSITDTEEAQKQLERAAAEAELPPISDVGDLNIIPTIEKPKEEDEEDSTTKFKKLLSKISEKVAAQQKEKKKDKQLKERQRLAKPSTLREIVEDPDIEDEVNFLSRCGVKNQLDTLRLSRLIVRAKLLPTRLKLLDVLQKGELPCRRLFLDYHGLRLMHGWMNEDADDMKIRLAILETLECLPVANKTMLMDSKVYHSVRGWCGDETLVQRSASPSDESSRESEQQSPKIVNFEEKLMLRIQKLAVKLISLWDGLPEIFRIPKRERIEQMKEHEREADMQYAATSTDPNNYIETDRYQCDRFRRDIYRIKKFSKPFRGRDSGSPDLRLFDDSKHLSKKERREMFAAQVARDEAERRINENRREHETRCRLIGLDPRRTRLEDVPHSVNADTGDWFNAHGMLVSEPPNVSHLPIEIKKRSTEPQDYILPPACTNLPPEWKFSITPEGYVYYFHKKQRISQWEPPTKVQILACKIDSEEENEVLQLKDMDKTQVAAYIKQQVALIKQKRIDSLVQKIPISPRRDEDRLYNQIEVRKYKENKEKIRKRKEEIKRKRAEIANLSTKGLLEINTSTETKVQSEDEFAPPDALPIQDYLLSSDEEDIGIDCDNSLIDKIVQGEKIVDELDALTSHRKLKRTLPRLRETESDVSVNTDTSDVESVKKIDRAIISKTTLEKNEIKRRKLEKKEKSKKNKDSDYKYRKLREKFRCEIASIIVPILKLHRKDSCTLGRIQTESDFRHLARKLTHFVMVKELKYCESVGQTLVVTESVKSKARDFIKKYMAKYGKVYIRPENDPEFKDIPFLTK